MTESENKLSPPVNPGNYEKRDISAVRVMAFGILGVLLMVIIIVVIAGIFTKTSEKLVEEMVLKPQSVAIRELRAREAEELNSYKLLDPQKGVYRIPIDRAIEIMADEAYRKNAEGR